MAIGKVSLPIGEGSTHVSYVLEFRSITNIALHTYARIPEDVTHIDMFLVSGGRCARDYGGAGGFACSWYNVDITEIPGYDPVERTIEIYVGRGGSSRNDGGQPSRVGNDTTIPINYANQIVPDFTKIFPWNDAPYTVPGAVSFSVTPNGGSGGSFGVVDGQGIQGGSDGGDGTQVGQGFSTRAFNQKYDDVLEEWITINQNSTNELFSGGGSARTNDPLLDPTPGGDGGGGAGARLGDALADPPIPVIYQTPGIPGKGGGGGAASGGSTGAPGGSGCVIIRYNKPI